MGGRWALGGPLPGLPPRNRRRGDDGGSRCVWLPSPKIGKGGGGEGQHPFYTSVLASVLAAPADSRPGTCGGVTVFLWTAWPPNSLRSAARTFMLKLYCWRERKRR